MAKFDPPEHRLTKDLFYLDQCDGHLDNACGTIAVIHSLLNNRDYVGLTGSQAPIERYYESAKGLNYLNRGVCLDKNTHVAAIHNSMVAYGQSAPLSGDKVCHHFVCLLNFQGHLVEMDGSYNNGPFVVTELGEDGFLNAAAEFIKRKYIDTIGTIQFSLMALVMA